MDPAFPELPIRHKVSMKKKKGEGAPIDVGKSDICTVLLILPKLLGYDRTDKCKR
jgi:hypothetical protein